MNKKELREKSIKEFNKDYIRDIDMTRKIVRSYHGLCRLSEKVCNLQNDEKMCNSNICTLMEAKEERHIKRLNECLQPYGLKVMYPGIYPVISEVNENNAIIRSAYYWTEL